MTLAVSLSIPLAAGGLGSVAAVRAIPVWYRHLRKPRWTPPERLFGPAWTALYLLMGLSAWLVAQSGRDGREVRRGLTLYTTQLALNTLWTPIFFGLRAPALALLEIVALWGLIMATVVDFYRLRPVAGLLLLPYLAWTTFATALNVAIWRLNREE